MERWNKFSITQDWEKFESNQKSVAPNALYVPHNTKEIRHVYKSKYNLKRKNLVILLMITDGKKWHYLAVKGLSALPRGITSKLDGEFYCWNCFHSYSTKNKLEKHKSLIEDRDYYYVEMPDKDNKILEYHHKEKSMKHRFVIDTDLESLLGKIISCYNNPEKSSTTIKNKHKASGHSLFTQCRFDATKNKLDC